jgi:hypothetical protein
MSEIDSYRHLNYGNYPQSKLEISIDIEELAKKIIEMNYGVHRLLSAIVRQRLEKKTDDKLATGIFNLLNKGLY